MLRALLRFDGFVASTRPAWLWLGQVALIALGVHLVADRLDDLVFLALTCRELPWPSSGAPALLAAGAALVVELAVVAHAAALLWRSDSGVALRSEQPAARRLRAWWARRSVDAIVRPLFWGPVALAGAWSVSMAAEDVLAPWSPELAQVVGPILAVLVALRLGASGFWRVVAGTPEPRRRVDGLMWAAPLLLVAILALVHGLPLIGLLP